MRISSKGENCTIGSVGLASRKTVAQTHLAMKITELNLQQRTGISTGRCNAQAGAGDMFVGIDG